MESSDIKTQTLFYKADPLTKLIREKLTWSPGKATVIIVIILNIPVITLAFIYNIWVGKSGMTGLLNDYGWWIYQLIGVPAILFFFLGMPNMISDVLVGLKNNKVIETKKKGDNEDKKYNEFIVRFAKSYSSLIWGGITVVGVLIFMVFAAIPEHKLFTSWQTTNNIIFTCHEIFWFLIFLVAGMAIVKTILAIYWFNKLFREFQTDVKVLHPDRAGGLSPLGNFSVKIGYMIGLLGFLVIVVLWTQSTYLLAEKDFSLRSNPAILSLSFAYLILAPIVFFAPIGSAHSAMKKAKNDFIIAISDQFENDFTRLQLILNKDGTELKVALEKIEHLQKIHSMVSQFPIWPFNTSSIVRFFSSVFSPIILSIIPGIIIDLFTK
jgi:hypothetical protein